MHPLRSLVSIIMKKTRCSRFACLAVCNLLLTGSAVGQGLVSLQTQDQQLIYIDPLQTFLAPHAARCYQNALAAHESILGFDPDQKATIFLRDFSDYGNASASGVPRNLLLFDIAPMNFTFETFSTSERMCNLMNHELVHVVASDQATSSDKRARRLLGGKIPPLAKHPESVLYSYATNPRLYAPRWYHEGIAVFLETWMGGGYGRAQGAYDEMVFRSMVRDEAHFYDPLGLESEGTEIDFQVGVNHYLYGTRFVSYLAYTYSPARVIEWIRRQEGSERHYTAQFEKVFGASLNEVWQDWIAFEHEFQEKNLAGVRQFPVTEYEDISDRGLGSVSRFFLGANNKLHWALRYPGVVAHIGDLSLDSGEMRNLVDIKGPMLYSVTSLAFDAESETIFYTADNYAWRDLMALDLESGRSRMLLEDARIGELVYNGTDRSLWGVRHVNGIATIVRMPYPYERWNQVHSLPYGQVLYDLDISPDGSLLSASFGEANGRQSLRVFDLDKLLNERDVTPFRQFDFGQAVPEGFAFSPDGRYLFGSSYFTGISNIFRFEIETSELEAVSNAETGFFRPVPLEDGRLIVLRYTGEGFLPTYIDPVPLDDVSNISFLGTEVVRAHPELQEWQAGSPADVPLEQLTVDESPYTGFGNIGLQSIYPIIEGYKDEFAAGLTMNFADPIQLESIDLSVSHSIASDLPSSEDIHAELEWRHVSTRQTPLSGVWTTTLRHNAADFYDLFGPTKLSRKGQSISVGYEKILIYDKPRELELSFDVSHYMNLDRLPLFQNVDVTIDELTTATSVLSYEHVRKSLGAVDDEKGFKWRLIATGNRVNGETTPIFLGELDFGFALPWNHASLWLRNSAGFANGDVDDPFANFFFGGFGNNYVDSGEPKRYREWYAMPGFELNEISGRNFYRSMLEFNLPPVRFRNAGGSRFYLSWARPALFAGTLVTNSDDSALRRNVSTAGIQIDFQFTVLSQLSMMLSMGYAVGFGDDVAGSPDEFMVSLKIM